MSMATTVFREPTVHVSRLGFGAMGLAGWFGGLDRAEAVRSLHAALDRGVSFIDTARGYGESERIIGEALAGWSGSAPFIATKVPGLRSPRQWGTPTPLAETFPPGHIRASAEVSCRALGVDRIDLLQLHTWWASWGTEGRWLDELRAVRDAGLVRFIGVSLPDHRHDMALELARSGAVDAIQTVVNIFDPQALELLAPACAENSVALIARCILDEGGLTGFLTEDAVFADGDFRKGYFDIGTPRSAYITRVDRLRRYVPAVAGSLAELAIRFALQSPTITTAITSMHHLPHALANIEAASKGPLPEDVFEALFTKHRFTKNLSEFKLFGMP